MWIVCFQFLICLLHILSLLLTCSDFGAEKAITVSDLQPQEITQRLQELIKIGASMPKADGQSVPVRS